MKRESKIALVQRSLGIRHKLKVLESMRAPDAHEELAVHLLARWDLEDELQAIESSLQDDRNSTIEDRKRAIRSEYGDGAPPPRKKK